MFSKITRRISVNSKLKRYWTNTSKWTGMTLLNHPLTYAISKLVRTRGWKSSLKKSRWSPTILSIKMILKIAWILKRMILTNCLSIKIFWSSTWIKLLKRSSTKMNNRHSQASMETLQIIGFKKNLVKRSMPGLPSLPFRKEKVAAQLEWLGATE